MKILIITNLFPNNLEKERGLFNKQQFNALSKLCEIRIIAPLAWTPKSAGVHKEEMIDGIKTYHPTHWVIPKIGRRLLGRFYYDAIKETVKKVHDEFAFDVILATWAYPDCYAASLIAQNYQKPLVCRVHGSDINIGITSPWRSTLMATTFRQAKGIIAVTAALKEKIISLGIEPKKIHVIPNGIDEKLFKKLDKTTCRQKLGFKKEKQYVLFIGNLVEVKGIKYLIEAMKNVPEHIDLNIIGSGELIETLSSQIASLGLSHRVTLRGRMPHDEIPIWLNASDIFCLPSLNEGCPNVVVEALACGLPIVASNVGGIPELVDERKGVLVDPADAKALAAAIKNVMSHPHDFNTDQGDRLSWQDNAKEVLNVLSSSVA